MPQLGLGMGLHRGSPLFSGLLNAYPGAAAAYSLRRLGGYGGPVVEVRRSSDSTAQGFTANQITSGAMLDFVGGDNTIIQSEDFSSAAWNKSSGRAVITSDSITAPDGELTADLATWSTPSNADGLRQDTNFLAQEYTASVYLKYNSSQWVQLFFGSQGFAGGHANFDLINGVIGSNKVGSSSIEDIGDGWYRCSVTRTASTSGNTAICATVPVSSGAVSRFGSEVAGAYYVWGAQKNEGPIKAYTMTTTGVSGDGFVSKWYDQSGNGNDAIQIVTTSQPKIVSAGALVTGGLDFDGVDDSLGLAGLSLNSTGWSSFVKWNADSFATDMAIFRCRPLGAAPGVAGIIPLETSATGKFSQNILEDNSVEAIGINASPFGSLSTATDYVNTAIFTSNAVDLWTNSSQETYTNSLVGGSTIPISSVGVTQLYIGTADGSARPFNGKICEVILYDSDQTANRAAIEALI